MCLKFAVLTLACFGGLAAQRIPLKRAATNPLVSLATAAATGQDQFLPEAPGLVAAATHVGPHHHHHGGKYFQYIHVPAKDHYEHGHKRGNHHHFIERHERGHPHAGEFKTKVRWGDKHGGYGEHLWDYNHAGHDDHHDDGEESQQHESYEAYDETQQVPQVAQARGKRNPDEEVEFVDEKARQQHHSGRMPKHGGNYRREPDYRSKREPGEVAAGGLFFDQSSGYIVDEATGLRYQLTPA